MSTTPKIIAVVLAAIDGGRLLALQEKLFQNNILMPRVQGHPCSQYRYPTHRVESLPTMSRLSVALQRQVCLSIGMTRLLSGRPSVELS